jgi:hypothetical protein
MDLIMINAIEEFNEDSDERVDMGVCVCSGSANCGSVGIGTRKFDIFSNDVILANKVENWTSLFLLFN